MEFFTSALTQPLMTPIQVVQCVLLAYVIGQLAAWIYMYTHTGISYSQSFVQSIVMLTVVLSIGMMVIGNNLAIAFGMLGALAVIRFRNILKDTRDTAFIFFSLIIGLATGTGRVFLALVGTVAFGFIVLTLYWTRFGARVHGNGFIRIKINTERCSLSDLDTSIRQVCSHFDLVSQQFQNGGSGEVAYRISLKPSQSSVDIVETINDLDGAELITITLHEEQLEI
jgi:hypothetical protein